MSDLTDGASQGITPARTLGTILGGEPEPEPDEEMTPGQMRKWIMASPGLQPGMSGGEGYDAAAREAAKRILIAFEADPSLLDAPIETEYDWDGDPDHGVEGMKMEFVIRLGLNEVLRERGVSFSDLGLSGFQYGWAANAARTCVGRQEEPNPALIEIGD